MSKTVNIIGAGPGGLASAILLGSAGFRVRVFDRLREIGGRTSSLRAEGYRFDLGPTFFLYPRILDEVMRAAGTSLDREVEMVRLDPQYRVVFGQGGSISATPDPVEMERQIAAISPGDAAGFRRFLADNREKFSKIRACLARPFLGWGSLLSSDVVDALPHIRPWESVDTYLKRFFSDERVRLTFSFQSKYLGMSPFRCPSLFSILSYLEYDYGVWHPMGGCGEVSEAMARVAKRLGVEFHMGEEVRALEFEGKRVTAVRTDEDRYGADATVVNADFAHAMRRLVPDALRTRWTDAKLDTKRFSCSTFMMYLGVEGEVPDLAHHTIHISSGYERNLEQIEVDRTVPEDPSFYVQNACVTDRSLAPAGHSALYVLAPVPHRSPLVDWKRDAPGFRARLFRKMKDAGYGDIESRIRYERVVTPDDWEHGYAIHRGATFNLAHTLTQMLHLRPRNRFEDIDGMYLVGGGTHPGSGLPVIYEGARITSSLLCEDFGVSTPWATEGHAVSSGVSLGGEEMPRAAKVAAAF